MNEGKLYVLSKCHTLLYETKEDAVAHFNANPFLEFFSTKNLRDAYLTARQLSKQTNHRTEVIENGKPFLKVGTVKLYSAFECGEKRELWQVVFEEKVGWIHFLPFLDRKVLELKC